MLECLEKIIVEQSPEPEKEYLEAFRKNLPLIKSEMQNLKDNQERQFFDIEGNRNIVNASLMRSDIPTEIYLNAQFRMAMTLENVVRRHQTYRLTDKAKSSVDQIDKQLDKYTGKNIGEAIYGN